MASNPKLGRPKAKTFFSLLFSPSKRRRLQNIKMLRRQNETAKKMDIENYVRKTYKEQRQTSGVELSARRTYHYMVVHILDSIKMPEKFRPEVERACVNVYLASNAAASYIPINDCRELLRNFIEAAKTLAADDISTRKFYLHDAAAVEKTLNALENYKKDAVRLTHENSEQLRYAFDAIRKKLMLESDYKLLYREETKGIRALNILTV